MSKHTPGPWHMQKYNFWIDGPNGSTVLMVTGMGCCADPSFDISDADLNLIQAAPDLYWALNNILNGINTKAIILTTDQDEVLQHAMSKAYSAISKAEGK